MNKYTVGIILGVLGACLYPAQADPVLEQAPIVLEYNLAGPALIESEPIFAAGIIKTICVSYEFTGQARLEASANSGAAYTKIINGQPLVDGFIPGNQLRFKVIIGPGSSLKKLTIGYTDSSGVSRLYRNPDLANYKNHQEIYISGGSRELFNYPLKVDLSRGGLNLPYLNNIYFTAADGQTPLYYYVESEIASSPAAPRNDTTSAEPASEARREAKQSRNNEPGVIANPPKAGEAIYWVKVPQIPKDGTKIYVYYNGVIASPERAKQSQKEIAASPAAPRNDSGRYNDGNKVFPFFEDFNGASLNEEKWEIIPGLKKEYGVKDGYLRLKDCLAVTRDFKTQQGILEFKAKAEENAGIQAVVRTKVSAGLSPYEQIVYSSNYPGAEHTIAINNIAKVNISKPIQPLTYYIYQATLNSTGILFERYSANRQEKQAEIKFLDVGNFDEGYLGLKADAGPFSAGSIYFDWIRVRPYVEVEPRPRFPIGPETVSYVLFQGMPNEV